MKVDYKRYNKKNLMPKEDKRTLYGLNTANRNDNLSILYKFQDMYDRLYDFRKIRQRNINYMFGRQWSDPIDAEDENGITMTEEMNIKAQGKVPLKNNMIRPLVKTILGVFRGNKNSPMAVPRDKVEQSVADMLSISLQYSYQANDVWELDARTLEEFLASGFAVQNVRWRWNRSRMLWDSYVSIENPAMCFFNGDTQDPRGDDISTFGVVRDLRISEILEIYATNKDEAIRIRRIYETVNENLPAYYQAFSSKRFEDNSFLTPADTTKCRVIEAWTLESKQRLRVHDTLNGKVIIMELEDMPYIEKTNNERIQEAKKYDISEDEVPLMEYEWFIDRFWYTRHLTPTGESLFEGETQYEHNEHPFIFKAYPLINGEVHSFVEDIIDQQRYINRLITMVDFIMGASAKGVLVFPEESLGSMTKQEVLDEWVKYNGVIFAKVKNGAQMPQQISTNATNVGAYELLNIQMKLLSDISGVHGALQGKSAAAGTPAALYAQESQNASTNLLDLFETFNNFRKRRDYKLLKVNQQYYDSARYLNIVGNEYKEESKMYDPEKVRNIEFDIVISEANDTPAYRMVMNNFLMEMFKLQAIDVKTMLEGSSLPFADKLLNAINKKEEEMAKQQQSQQMQIPTELQQNANPQAMQLINQAIG